MISYLSYLLSYIIYSIKCSLGYKEELFCQCIWCNKMFYTKSFHRKISKMSNSFNKSENLIYNQFCSKKCYNIFQKEKYQKFKHNNRCKHHKFQRLSYKNVCWDCYKIDYLNKIKNIPIKLTTRLYLKFHGFKIIPTFRTSKNYWAGDKQAFEQFLLDNNVKYFVYIKFYVRNKTPGKQQNNPKPIVCGKSGSLRVNYSGSDLSFSTDINHGPARHFLSLHNFSWYYDAIAIKKCRNEQKAYEIESKTTNDLDLFGS